MAPARGVDINGAAVRAIRELRGLSLSVFARDIGVSVGYACNIEKGYKNSVSPEVRDSIRKRLDVSIDAISHVGAAKDDLAPVERIA